MDFDLTPEQREIQATVRQFVDERVLPNAIENDINHHLDLGIIEGMAELGLLGIVIPEEYGGAGLDFVSEALVCEEIERGEAAFRTLISVHVGLNSLALLRYATEEQKQRYLAPQARGEKIACFGLTEPAAGSDVAAMLTNARREGDAYVLNGQKNWISYASVADHALVFAKTDPEAKHKGISAFIVETGWHGVSAADTENKLGIWAGSTGELFFENVEVPAENLLGEEGQGFEIAMYGLDQGRFTVAAGACGVIRACLERSVAYARERETFGKPIGKHQFVQDMIAEMVLGYETSKLLVMQAAWLKDKGVRNTRETSLAKWHATESAFQAAHLAIQVHGAYGYSAEYGVERHFRNARAPIIYEGTTQIHKMMQAEHALGYRNLNGKDGDASPIASWAPGAPRPLGPMRAHASRLRSSSWRRLLALPAGSAPPATASSCPGESLGGVAARDDARREVLDRVGPEHGVCTRLRRDDLVLQLDAVRARGRRRRLRRGRAVHALHRLEAGRAGTRPTGSSWARPEADVTGETSSPRRSARATATRRSSRPARTRVSAFYVFAGIGSGASGCCGPELNPCL